MSLSYVRNKQQMPSYVDHQCAICLENVDADYMTNNRMPGCVICINGHRMHRECFDSWREYSCPTCRVKDIRNCYSSRGYGYGQRYGGRRINKTHKKRKTHKRKKTKTNRRSK